MVQPNWNPNAPGKKGIELLDVGYGSDSINAAGDVGELQYEAAHTGDLDQVQLYSSGSQSNLPSIFANAGRPMLLDLVDQGDEPWGALAYNDHSVSAVTGSAGMFNENLTTPVTTSRLNGNNDGLFVACSTINAFLDLQFSTGAYDLGRHVLAVEVWFYGNLNLRVGRFDPGGQLWFKDYPFWSNKFVGGAARWGETLVQHGGSTWSHWTPQMVRDFASGGTRKVRISCRAGAGSWALDRVFLRVFSIPERRRGVGIGVPQTGWVTFNMETPPATGAPAVTAGEELTMMVRRITDYNGDNVAGSVLPWRYMRGRAPDGGWRLHQQSFNPTVTTAANGTSLMPAPGPQVDGIPSVRMLESGVVIDDSMPYRLSRGAVVFGATTVSQYLTVTGGPTIYGQAFAVAGWVPTDGRPLAPLRAEVYQVTGGARVLDAVEVTAADVERLPVSAPVNNTDDQGSVYKTVQWRFPDGTALAAGQYELRISSPASTEERPWYVAALIGDPHTDDQTFGTDVDYAEGFYYDIDGFFGPRELFALTGADRVSDILAQLVEVPPPVTGGVTSIGSLTAHHAEVCDPNQGPCPGCADESMPFVALEWSPAPTGTPSTVAYQVDRMDDLSPDWERVALVWGIDTTRWDDHEARIGVRSEYRIRSVRSDAVTGDWSDPVPVVVPAGQVALTFSSNAATGMGCVYPEVWEGEVVRPWEFLEAADVQLRRMFGRDRQVAFRPLERRGDGFTRTLLLNALCSVLMPTMGTFQPLRDLAWAPIPYVCVRDGEGNRWFATLRVPEGVNRRADTGNNVLWLAELEVIEVAASPTVHDTSVPQVEGVPRL